MRSVLQTVDLVVFAFYFIIVAVYGILIYRRKRKKDNTSADYFLAEGSLTWWAIGASLIASNISAEQMIGMSGSGFKIGLAIASYEWMGAATLLVVAFVFVPIYSKKHIMTMPGFLHRRYGPKVAFIMSLFWLALYIVVNLTSILYLGALTISSVYGVGLDSSMIFLAFFALLITWGGMKVIGYTDVIQVFFLILGGLVTTYLALEMIAKAYDTTGVFNGLRLLRYEASDHFHMIFKQDNPNYLDLPGLSVLIGGMWIVNLNYWGCNQYITQRALGANVDTAQKGLIFAAILKLIMPVIVCLPGIAAFLLHKKGVIQMPQSADGAIKADSAYSVLLGLLPAGLKGLSFAALTAAVVASLAGKVNSIATIFTLDIYQKRINPQASEKKLISIGKLVIFISLVLAILIAPKLGIDQKGGFQYIQEFTGFVSPGILAMFLSGFFLRKANASGAMFSMIAGLLLSVLLKFLPLMVNLHSLSSFGLAASNSDGVYEIPFIDRMGIVFIFCMAGMFYFGIRKSADAPAHFIRLTRNMFVSKPINIILSLLVLLVLIFLYILFW